MGNKLEKISTTSRKLSLSTQLVIHSPSPVNLQCYAQAVQPEFRHQNTYCLPFVQRYTRSGCPSWLSLKTVVIQAHDATKLYEILLASTCGPRLSHKITALRIYGTMYARKKITYEKSPFDSLAWGSLTFAPIRSFQNSMCNWKLTSCNTAVFIYPVLRHKD